MICGMCGVYFADCGTSASPICPLCAREARRKARRERSRANRKAREEAYRALGLRKVKGALGGMYWE